MPVQEDPEVTLGALRWTMDQLHRPGDVIHIVHVIKCLVHKLEVFHGESALLSAPSDVFRVGHSARGKDHVPGLPVQYKQTEEDIAPQACQGLHSHLMILARHTESRRMWPEPNHSSSAGMPQTHKHMIGHPASQLESAGFVCGSALYYSSARDY